MPNPEHLAILKSGVETWNAWRNEHPDLQPDLQGAPLREIDLAQANLFDVDFTRADLTEADFTEANLRKANLYRAILEEATFTQAHLDAANLTEANLSSAQFLETSLLMATLVRADLSFASFLGTNLRKANLNEADLSFASLYETSFTDTDLTGVKGLHTCHHVGPSPIDHRTLARSGHLPLEFLRGCGLPDFIIDNLASLRGDPTGFYSCFISYCSKDQDFARRLHADLQNHGVRCYFALEDIKGGLNIYLQIDQAIRAHDKLLLILSEQSMQSNWVQTEIKNARRREWAEGRQMLFPVRLCAFEALRHWELFDADEGRDLAAEVRAYYIPDFSNWTDHDAYQQAFDRLLRDLKAAAT